MSIALDATYSTGSQLSGVGVYSRELMSQLALAHPRERFLHCYRPHRLLRALRETRPGNCLLRPLWEGRQWMSPRLFHGLNQRLPASRLARAVVTFHDLFVMTAEYSTPEFRERFTRLARDTARRADLIVCVSRFTADQVRDLLGVEESRLRVVHHGVRFRAASGIAREPIILHVGALQKRKNLALLVRAFSLAAPPPWRLVLAGGDGYGASEVHQEIERSPARDRIQVTGWIPDLELACWYERARLLAFPSLDEGFGIPALEAMACGVPVLASNRGSLPEICAGAAWILDAMSQDQWTDALGNLTGNPELLEHWAGRARERRPSSWAESAEHTWQVYQELL